jgi:hypothetical protein
MEDLSGIECPREIEIRRFELFQSHWPQINTDEHGRRRGRVGLETKFRVSSVFIRG